MLNALTNTETSRISLRLGLSVPQKSTLETCSNVREVKINRCCNPQGNGYLAVFWYLFDSQCFRAGVCIAETCVLELSGW